MGMILMTSFIVVSTILISCRSLDSEFFELGTINFGHLKSSVPSIRQKEEEKMLYAMEHVGFMIITNHGISKDIMDNMWNQTQDFFDTSIENKRSVLQTEDYLYGYGADEMLSASEEIEYFNDENDKSETKKAPKAMIRDQNEMFSAWIGADNDKNRLNDVLWPQHPIKMKNSWISYYRECELIAAELLKSFASILELKEDFFEPFIDDHMSAIRANSYPEQNENNRPQEGSFRCSAHSDYGTFTLLRQDGVGGLQLDIGSNDNWVDVVADHYDFIVNLGNAMKLWTNDRFKSTRHRVVNPRNENEAQRRQSIAFFHNLNGDAMIETIDSCKDENGKSKYEPIMFLDFLRAQTNYV